MSRWRGAGAERVYAAAQRWVNDCLEQEGSLFTPGENVWSPRFLDDLHARFNENPDESSANFEEKFRKQLTGASRETIQVAAEIMYVHVVIAADYKGQTKRKLVNTILSWAQQPVGVPADLDLALDAGLCNTGQGYKMYRPKQLWFLIDFVRAWKRAASDARAEWLRDPWSFKAMLWSLPVNSAYLQRNALLHLVHPDTFEPMVSPQQRELIVKAFAGLVDPATEDIDAKLQQIRRNLTLQHGPNFEFWNSEIMPIWSQKPSPPKGDPVLVTGPAPTGSRHAWLVRGANVDGQNLIDVWLGEGFCSIGWAELGDLPDDISRDELLRRYRGVAPDLSDSAIYAGAGNVQRFLTSMQTGDLVVTPDGSDVYVGEISTDAYWVEAQASGSSRRRDVRWLNPSEPFDRASLPPRLYSKMRTLLTVSDLTDVVDDLEQLLIGGDVPTAVLAEPTAELATELHCRVEWLREIAALLRRKRQAIFYGPPGTGKTYIAQELADHFTANGGSTKLVQFHPSYAYEDFVEGYRPQSAGDSVGFALMPGPFRQLADAARQDPSNPYLLIIDEINRANLAKVFGELYFLLEYRDRSIDLQYSPGVEFTLPSNLYVIGTMNTADRSIALVDAAMRRRFFFVPFFAQDGEIAGMLRSWLKANDCSDKAARLLEALNDRIGDPDFAVGPSYLMAPDIDRPEVLQLVWKHSILPLLEEHFYGRANHVQTEFGLDAISAAAGVVP